ncbi:MAG: hypothetical protein KJO26_11555, partial [Deltaproteobacteria bacterium]|nr:hypothetical protein [Deltaproteobacteria bacterium]
MGCKARRFFGNEAIHAVCRVPEKALQRSRWDFLRCHQQSIFQRATASSDGVVPQALPRAPSPV